MISPERLYLASDLSTVVKEGDSRASSLLVGKDCFIDDATAAKYGITPNGLAVTPSLPEPIPALSAETVTSDAALDPEPAPEPIPARAVSPTPVKPPVFAKPAK